MAPADTPWRESSLETFQGTFTVKLRMVDDSIRLRLSRSEVAEIEHGAPVECRTNFPGGAVLTYVLGAADVTTISATLMHGRIDVTLPRAVAHGWAAGTDVSLRGEQKIDGGLLKILVEKDFTCVEPRDGEDQTDLYPNPKSESRG